MKESFAYVFLFLAVLAIAMIPVGNNNIEKIKYCHIDSTYVQPNTEFIPEVVYKYRTDCDIVFTSKKEYHLGDSIQVKTIIIE